MLRAAPSTHLIRSQVVPCGDPSGQRGWATSLPLPTDIYTLSFDGDLCGDSLGKSCLLPVLKTSTDLSVLSPSSADRQTLRPTPSVSPTSSSGLPVTMAALTLPPEAASGLVE